MREGLISIETAKLAKEKGFHYQYKDMNKVLSCYYKGDGDGRCFCTLKEILSTNSFLSPTQSLLQKWIWENHKIWVELVPIAEDKKHGVYWTCRVWDMRLGRVLVSYKEKLKGDPYEIKEKGLFEALELIKK